MTQLSKARNRPKASGLGAFGLKVFNKLFLRSTIARTGKDVAAVNRSVAELAAQARKAARSNTLAVQLIDKRVEYMIARMDAYAEAEDKIDAALREEMRKRDEALTASIRELDRRYANTGKAMNALEQRISTIADAQARTISGLEDRLSEITSMQENVISSLQKLLLLDAADAHFAEIRGLLEKQAVEIRKNRSQIISAMERNATLVHDTVRQAALNEFRQREATQALVREMNFGLDADLGEGQPAAPDYLLQLYRHIVRRRPSEVVVLGCGLSTLVAAAALAANGSGRLVAIDEDEARASTVNAALAAHGLSAHAHAHHAPLVEWIPPQPTRLGTSWQWYEMPAATEALETIDLVIVEGPRTPKAIYARYPAIPQLRTRMPPGSAALLPDAKRSAERAVATEWARLNDMRADFVDDAVAGGLAEVVVRVERPHSA